MDHGVSEFWGYEKFGGCYDAINGGQRKNPFFDLTLHLELTLDGYPTHFRTEKLFQETSHLGVF